MRIGIVGLGNQGKKHLSSIICLSKKFKLVGICDVNSEKSLAVPLFTSYLDLYKKTKPDVVIICTPNYLHKRMVIDALRLGIHVIKEKPLAISYDDAFEMIKVAESKKRIIVTMQQRYYSPLYLKAKKLLAIFASLM